MTTPVFPGTRYLADPAGLPVHQVRPIIDEIDRRVQALLAELIPTPPELSSCQAERTFLRERPWGALD